MPGKELPKAYDPKAVEEKWYGLWTEHDYFHADVNAAGTAFSSTPDFKNMFRLGPVTNFEFKSSGTNSINAP